MANEVKTKKQQTDIMNSEQKEAWENMTDERFSTTIKSIIPKRRQEVLNWYGWGYKDSLFYVKNDVICFKGKRYPLAGCELPLFTEHVRQKFDIQPTNNATLPIMPKKFPEPTINKEFLQDLQTNAFSYSLEGEDRLIRSHGQALHDIVSLWQNSLQRIPDIVVWPQGHNDVEHIINAANKHNVMIIPYGGGTSVSGSVTCPQNEERMMCVLDTSQMNRMLWLNREDMTVCFESGIIGQELEQELRKNGLTVGHEPDSYEFSTLGGWVATRASGMKKNVYGNIEDLVVRVRLVTAQGVLERICSAPRISCGPDFNHIVLGSEGTLGVITEVVLKVRPLPPVKRYGSLAFPNFHCGVQFMREVALRRCQPASVRLMDNEQFILGQTLRSDKSWVANIIDQVKKTYVTKVKGINLEHICAATLLFEGESEQVQQQETLIYEIAKKFGGFPAGSQNGERGYILTFVIAYMRDFALQQGIIAESFETSVPWGRCEILCRNVKSRVREECLKKNIKHFIISCRVTQTYDAGACVYFYFAFKYLGIENPIKTHEFIENQARDEILACGGSISHHHGVGKVRSQWYRQTISEAGKNLYVATKRQLDPNNIFALNNLLTQQDWQEENNRLIKSKL